MKDSLIYSNSDKNRRYVFLYILLGILVVFFLLLNVSIGSVRVPFQEILRMAAGRETSDTYRSIIMEIRFPRGMAAVILGGALALSGYLLQTFFHNPIAGPFVLGISSGAKLTVALVMILLLRAGTGISSFVLILAAFAGSMLSM